MALDVYSLQIHYNIAGQYGMNVFHFQSNIDSGDNPDGIAKFLIQSWKGNLETPWLLCVPSDVALIGYKAKRVNSGGGPTVIQPQSGSNGDRAGHISTSGIGPCFIWGYNTGLGRWRAGRTFLPGVSESDIQENSFSATLLGLCDDFAELMLNAPTTPGGMDEVQFTFGILSGVHNTFSGAETGGVSGKPGVQNRRMKPSF